MLIHEGKLYDSKANLGVAHGYSGRGLRTLGPGDFNGGRGTVVPRLRALGFEVISVRDRASLPDGTERPERAAAFVERVVRSSLVAEAVKRIHGYACQVCDTRLVRPNGPYAEAAHIQPVGAPHDGPDVPGNVLCLCPNHHVLFDALAFSISDDLSLIGRGGRLRAHPKHKLQPASLEHHRARFTEVREQGT